MEDVSQIVSNGCSIVLIEIAKLRSYGECALAGNRVLGAMECLIARKILFCLLGSLNFVPKDTQRSKLLNVMESFGLNDIKKMINLLRLVQAGRVDRLPGKQLFVTIPGYTSPVCIADCLGNAVSLMASNEKEGGAQLLQVLAVALLFVAHTATHNIFSRYNIVFHLYLCILVML